MDSFGFFVWNYNPTQKQSYFTDHVEVQNEFKIIGVRQIRASRKNTIWKVSFDSQRHRVSFKDYEWL